MQAADPHLPSLDCPPMRSFGIKAHLLIVLTKKMGRQHASGTTTSDSQKVGEPATVSILRWRSVDNSIGHAP